MIKKIDENIVSLTENYFENEFLATSTLFREAFSELDISTIDESDKVLFENCRLCSARRYGLLARKSK